MSAGIRGIHHVTAIATDPATNLDFYTRLLGLRLVKKTVNFDDPGTYHLYYGDAEGRPGSVLTFFPWPLARRGSAGLGQVQATSFSVPAGSLDRWASRLAAEGVLHEEPRARSGERALTFFDPDGLRLELVASEGDPREPWEAGSVPPEMAVRGFAGVTLPVADLEPTAELLAGAMGFRPAGTSGGRHRFAVGGGGPGETLDVVVAGDAPWGRVAAGSVHHVAFRVAGDAEQRALRERLIERGVEVTPVVDRRYFRSVYFREPGGLLFEIATDPPGFTVDEALAGLGSSLRLPSWLEERRAQIEAALPPLEVTEGVR